MPTSTAAVRIQYESFFIGHLREMTLPESAVSFERNALYRRTSGNSPCPPIRLLSYKNITNIQSGPIFRSAFLLEPALRDMQYEVFEAQAQGGRVCGALNFLQSVALQLPISLLRILPMKVSIKTSPMGQHKLQSSNPSSPAIYLPEDSTKR